MSTRGIKLCTFQFTKEGGFAGRKTRKDGQEKGGEEGKWLDGTVRKEESTKWLAEGRAGNQHINSAYYYCYLFIKESY